MDGSTRITIEPGKRGGLPSIRGIRITVSDVLELLAAGLSVEQVLLQMPDLEPNDICACLEYGARCAGGGHQPIETQAIPA